MRQDDRARFDLALHRARPLAFAPGEFVGQESFMRASEIMSLASRPESAQGCRCWICAVASPDPDDSSLGSWAAAIWGWTPAPRPSRSHASGPTASTVDSSWPRPAVPAGPFDVVLLLETVLFFPDKRPCCAESPQRWTGWALRLHHGGGCP